MPAAFALAAIAVPTALAASTLVLDWRPAASDLSARRNRRERVTLARRRRGSHKYDAASGAPAAEDAPAFRKPFYAGGRAACAARRSLEMRAITSCPPFRPCRASCGFARRRNGCPYLCRARAAEAAEFPPRPGRRLACRCPRRGFCSAPRPKANAAGRFEYDRMRIPQAEVQFLARFGNAISHALNLEALAKSFAHALDHVGDERARQAVSGAVLFRLALAFDDDVAVFEFDVTISERIV